MKCPFRSYFNWLILFTYLVQLSLIFITCSKPTEIFDTNQYSTFWMNLESASFYLPWIFGTKTMLTDSIFFFAIIITPFLIIAYSQVHIQKFSNQKHVNFWCALVIRICQQFLCPIMTAPLIFRLSYLIEQVFILKNYSDLKMIISLIVASINIMLQIVHCYFASVFLFQIDFVEHSKADFYDGKYITLIYSIRIVISVFCFEFKYITNNIVASILIGFIFFLCFLTLYFRLTIQAHTSPIGQYLEVAPFFICPFMVLFKYFVKNEVYSLLLLIFLLVFFALLLKVHTYFMVKLCLKAFYPFISQSKQSQINNIDANNILPKFLIGSVTSVIRIVAAEYSDPDCLLRFLSYQKKTAGIRNSSVIEVVRFLALFPSKRKDCLKELKDFHSSSNFNSFMVFIFKKILKSLEGVESTSKNLVCLNNFFRSFLVHKHLFWVARKNKKVFIASKEGLSAAYFYIEVKNEFHYLMKRYAFDSFIHYYYADFCLSACGDFEKYLKEIEIARMLDNRLYSSVSGSSSGSNNSGADYISTKNDNKNSIVDPLLHPMTIVNPKILQFCSLKETKLNIHSARARDFDISNQLLLQNNAKKKEKTLKSRPVATFLTEKKHLIPLLSIFHFYFPIALFLYVIGELYIKDHQIRVYSDELYNISNRLVGTLYFASSSIYLPYLTNEYLKNWDSENLTFWIKQKKHYPKIKKLMFKETMKETFNFSTEKYFYNYYDLNSMKSDLLVNADYKEKYFLYDDDLLEIFFNLPFDIINFYSQLEPFKGMTTGMIFIFEYYISNNMLKNYTMQEVLDQIANDIDALVISTFKDIYDKVLRIKKITNILLELYKSDLEGYKICKVALISMCIFTAVSWIVYIIQINCIYQRDPEKIDFLSSKHLFSLFLLQDSKKAWELLRAKVENSSDNQTDFSITSPRSSVNLSSIPLASSHFGDKNYYDIKENIPNTNDTESNEEPLLETTVNGYDFNKDLRSLLNSNNFINLDRSKHNFSLFFRNDKNKTNRELNAEKDSIFDDENAPEEDNEEEEEENAKGIYESENSISFQEDDICEQAILISRATEKEAFLSYPYFHLVILLCAPLIFTVLVIAMFQIPLRVVAINHEKTFQKILYGESLANHSFILFNATFDILEKRIKKTKLYKTDNYFQPKKDKNISNSFYPGNIDENGDEIIYGLDEILSDLKNLSEFKNENCYDFFEIVCMSLETALNTIINSSTATSTIVTQCIPFIYLFTWDLFQDLFLSNVNDLFVMKISNGRSFIIATILLMLTVIHVSFSASILLKKAFNSLFHFPDDFLNPPVKNSKINSKNIKDKIPQNALVITSVTKTDDIYSVSDNSKEIINRNLNDLISMKMSDLFPKVYSSDSDDMSHLCEFFITEKKKKIFRYSSERIGCLTKTVLIEENRPDTQNTNENLLIQKFNGFIPKYFAEQYSKNDQNEFNFYNNFIISVRISHEISPLMIEKCFNSANHISQNSISIHIINVDGVMITFSSNSNCKLVVILLLIRDLIDDVIKNTKVQNCVYSVYVHFMKDFKVTVVNDEELYLEFQPLEMNFFRARLFQIDEGQIAFSESVKQEFQAILDMTERQDISIDLGESDESIYTIPFDQLSSKLVVFV